MEFFEIPTEKVKSHYTDDEIGGNPTWKETGAEKRKINENGQNGNGERKPYPRYPAFESDEPIPIGPIRPHNTSFAGFHNLNRISSGLPSNGLGPQGPGPQEPTPYTEQSQSPRDFPQSFLEAH